MQLENNFNINKATQDYKQNNYQRLGFLNGDFFGGWRGGGVKSRKLSYGQQKTHIYIFFKSTQGLTTKFSTLVRILFLFITMHYDTSNVSARYLTSWLAKMDV